MYLFMYQERGREGEKGEKHRCEKEKSVASPTRPDQGQNVPPRHVPSLGIKPANFHFEGGQPTN